VGDPRLSRACELVVVMDGLDQVATAPC